MPDVKVTLDAEISKSSIKTVEQELAQAVSVLGDGKSGGGGKKSAPEQLSESFSHLAEVMKDVMKMMNDQTKVVQQQVQLREKELGFVKEMQKITGGKPGSQDPFDIPEEEKRRRRYRGRGFQVAGSLIGATGSFMMGGGSTQSGLQFGNAIASAIAPEIAPILNAITGAAIGALDIDDRVKEAGLRGYQVAGAEGANQFIDPNNLTNATRNNLGFSAERFSAIQVALAKQQGDTSGIDQIMRGENEYGLGREMINLQSAGIRSGSAGFGKGQTNINDLFGASMALTIGEGLGRGRMGEVMQQLTAAINSNTRASTDISATTDRLAFVSGLGTQYRGNTSAAQEADAAIKGLGQGATPYTQYTMLRAAGMGQGKSYAEAWLTAQKGVDTVGGVSSKALIQANFGQWVQRYAHGSESEKASIVMLISRQTGMNGAHVEAILKELAVGMPQVDIAAGTDAFSRSVYQNASDPLLYQHRQQANREAAGAAGAGIIRHIQGWFGAAEGNIDAIQGGSNFGPVQGTGAGPAQSMNATFDPNSVINNTAFVNSWIGMESGGNIQSRDVGVGLDKYRARNGKLYDRGARGYAQITREEATQLGITSDSDFERLSTDSAYSKQESLKLMVMKAQEAVRDAAAHNLNWSGSDMLKLTKYEHGGSGYLNSALNQFEKKQGRAPESWDEFYQAMHGLLTGNASRALENANKITVDVVVSDTRVTAKVRTPTTVSTATGAPGQNVATR